MTLARHNDIRQMEAHSQELLFAFTSAAKISATHMLALRQIAWLNQTGSHSSAFQLITVLVLWRKQTTCYISTAQKRRRQRDKRRNKRRRMRVQGSGGVQWGPAHLSFWWGAQQGNWSWYTHCWERHNNSHPSLNTWLVKTRVWDN